MRRPRSSNSRTNILASTPASVIMQPKRIEDRSQPQAGVRFQVLELVAGPVVNQVSPAVGRHAKNYAPISIPLDFPRKPVKAPRQSHERLRAHRTARGQTNWCHCLHPHPSSSLFAALSYQVAGLAVEVRRLVKQARSAVRRCGTVEILRANRTTDGSGYLMPNCLEWFTVGASLEGGDFLYDGR